MNICLILPFYNEAARLNAPEFVKLAAAGLHLVLVDDGSVDQTPFMLARLAADLEGRSSLVTLPRNVGKAEAVRQGLLVGIARGASVVGYADADLATPVDELLRLARELQRHGEAAAVLGSRVRLAHRVIDRNLPRHYLGRIIATYIDVRARLDVYDTQCGAKFFRVTPALAAALNTAFSTRWLFDVELLVRLRRQGTPVPGNLREEPLEMWRDVGGSALRGRELVRVAQDFLRLELALRRRRPCRLPQ